jgi:hypothetical protein
MAKDKMLWGKKARKQKQRPEVLKQQRSQLQLAK